MQLDPENISLVVLCYNGWQYTHQLLMDIKQHCHGVKEVVVVDNASEDDNVSLGLEFWLGLNVLPLKVVRLSKNRGFVGGMNYGLKKATGEVIALFSNDVRITNPRFLSLLVDNFRCSGDILLGATVYTQDTGWNKFGGTICPYLSGHFLVATRDFWNLTNGFDTRYAPSDYEDVDLSMSAIMRGYDLIVLPEDTIKHLGGGTYGYNDERLARTKRNRIKFMEKWGLQE